VIFRYSFIIYVLLNLYVYLRVRSLCTSRRQKVLVTIAALVLIAAFPLTETLSHSSLGIAQGPLLLFGYLALPFLLYLFLLVLVRDIALAVVRALKLLPAQTMHSPRVRMVTLCLLLAIPVAIVVAGRIHFSDIRVNKFQITVPAKSSPLRHLRIALASDFHLNESTDEHIIERFVGLVNAADADLLLLPGDILEGDRQEEQLAAFEEQLRGVRTTYGKFASLGNHEFYGRRGKLNFFSDSDIIVLQDSAVVVNDAFTLVGRNDNHFGARKPIQELMRSAVDSLPVIVMDHRPTDVSSVSAAGPEILVCGHTHHGQLFPFNFITDRIYELSWGYRRFGNTHVFVTSGVRVWGPPVRTAGDSEIMLIDVTFEPSPVSGTATTPAAPSVGP
jgi:predicted MPP superfamily phosphohydrolase